MVGRSSCERVSAGHKRALGTGAEDTDESSLFLSVLTLGEIRKGISALPGMERRGRLESWLQHDLRSCFQGRILDINEAIADRWGTITALGAMAGKPVPVIDGLLAATAFHHNLTLVTRNGSDVDRTVFGTSTARVSGANGGFVL